MDKAREEEGMVYSPFSEFTIAVYNIKDQTKR